MTKLGRIVFFVVALTTAAPARADRLQMHGFGEGALGAAIPANDLDYQHFASPTFVFSLRGGLELWLFKRFGFAPEAQIDLIPVKTNDDTYRGIVINGTRFGADTPFGRYRFLVGGRFLADFGVGATYVRFLVGADYLAGSEQLSVDLGGFRANVRYPFSSTAFTLQPGVGIQFRFLRYAIAGLSVDLPVAFHSFAQPDLAGIRSFTAIDFDLLGTIGFRL
jgi:hypothetical protein